MATKKTTPTFADNLASLEQIVANLEDNGTSLETSLTQFERGIQLVRAAQADLMATEQKVMQLLEAGDASGGLREPD